MTDLAPYQGRRTLVTGATGVIGGWLVRELLRLEADVVALIRDVPPGCEFVRSGDIDRVTRVYGTLEDPRVIGRALNDYDIDLIFHLGAQTQVITADRDPWPTMEANVRGTYTLLEAVRLRRASTSLVVASSDKAYGASKELPYKEGHPLLGRGIYDASKSAADLLSTAYAQSYVLPIAIARCGNVFGGGDLNWDRIVPGTIRSLLRKERPILRSDGSPKRDYIYVQDAVGAYLRLGEAVQARQIDGEAFNFGHNCPVAVTEIVDALRTIVGADDLMPIVEARRLNEIPAQWLDATKAEERLGWRPAYSLVDGLRETVDWYRRHFAL
jgi:CDP-glucose 4,6-dehydratase